MAGTMVGRTLNDRYEITERVGLGGMAEVYRANDKVLGRMVAVKVMLPQYAADPTFTQRFRQEAASAAKLQSPYIVSIYDWVLMTRPITSLWNSYVVLILKQQSKNAASSISEKQQRLVRRLHKR